MAFVGLNEGFEVPQKSGDSLFVRLRRDLAARIRGEEERVAAPHRLAGPDPHDQHARGYMADLDIEANF